MSVFLPQVLSLCFVFLFSDATPINSFHDFFIAKSKQNYCSSLLGHTLYRTRNTLWYIWLFRCWLLCGNYKKLLQSIGGIRIWWFEYSYRWDYIWTIITSNVLKSLEVSFILLHSRTPVLVCWFQLTFILKFCTLLPHQFPTDFVYLYSLNVSIYRIYIINYRLERLLNNVTNRDTWLRRPSCFHQTLDTGGCEVERIRKIVKIKHRWKSEIKWNENIVNVIFPWPGTD